MADRLTIAVPSCNGSRHLPDALRSILAQTDQDFDFIVCDDRSEDDTIPIVHELCGDRARVSINSERLGLAGNWNRCVEMSSTPWVMIFHQDDMMHADHVARHRDAFANHAQTGMIVSAANVIDDEGREVSPAIVGRGGLGNLDAYFAPGELLPQLAVENPIRCSAVSIRAAAFVDAGKFDPSYRYVVDWDCWIRIARHAGVSWLAKPSVDMRWHLASETHRFKTGTEDLDETIRLLDRLYENEGWSAKSSQRRAANRRLSRAFLNRAYEGSKAGDFAMARSCLRRSIALWPGILGQIALDPRLAVRMASLMMK